ncbi:hypothetical protein QBC37DRAFT_46759 [Rhypophila decipiens]|uniref:Uncharacterized protein n=1 Tax=Rhypophila decipiens TaxID=261697 RepID=A0AAN6YEA6_9PEZI|nr:hypothetical protein QBC37DRAFT_46759 [Rhypophila decipiens]
MSRRNLAQFPSTFRDARNIHHVSYHENRAGERDLQSICEGVGASNRFSLPHDLECPGKMVECRRVDDTIDCRLGWIETFLAGKESSSPSTIASRGELNVREAKKRTLRQSMANKLQGPWFGQCAESLPAIRPREMFREDLVNCVGGLRWSSPRGFNARPGAAASLPSFVCSWLQSSRPSTKLPLAAQLESWAIWSKKSVFGSC